MGLRVNEETTMQVVLRGGIVVGAQSFTTGFVSLRYGKKRMTEEDLLAHGQWLENHGRADEIDDLLEQWCAGVVLYCR